MNILSLGEKIKKIRKSKNMTLKDLAGDRITAAQISHIERDKSHTSYELLEYIAQKLEITTEYLLETKEVQAQKITSNLMVQSKIAMKNKEWDKAEKLINEVIDVCIKYSINDDYAEANYILADIMLSQGHQDEALKKVEKAIYYFIRNNDNKNVFKGYCKRGKIYIKEKFYRSGLLQLETALNILNQTSEEDMNVYRELYSGIAYCSIKMRDNDKAQKYIKLIENLEENENIDEKVDILMLKANQGFSEGNFDKSREYFSKVLHLLEQGKVQQYKGDIYLIICKVYQEMADYENVLSYSMKVYDVTKKDENEYTMESLFNIIQASTMLKKYDMAFEYSKIALTIAMKTRNKINEYRALKGYSEIYKYKEDIPASILYLSKGIEVATQSDDDKIVADGYIELAHLHSGIDKEKELEFYRKGIDIYRDLGII